MNKSLQELIGKELDTFTFRVETGKIREYAEAIGDLREEYVNGEKILPTFPTVIEYWGGGYLAWYSLGLDKQKVLHGEQEYEYIGKIKPGDTITVHSIVEDAYTKSTMNFIILKKEYFNGTGQLVLRSRSTIVERH
ncbi:MaoC family dehydratase N-terminal domain-containing protein [Psychrobacillus sp. OK032]|uniref:FAS1-like dehydratase domain-containing protein n=1 Tax=Psychrobacillus sp. OK032 TaxID=1884358 RepID=UPI0008CCF4B8|nr:MaoC family dehydratase N-terminal domain-containing protein [Psychrobacillus sp. OK032]SER82797.1 Acyl dehydratase [Psychrobacillus sp. OK032]